MNEYKDNFFGENTVDSCGEFMLVSYIRLTNCVIPSVCVLRSGRALENIVLFGILIFNLRKSVLRI